MNLNRLTLSTLDTRKLRDVVDRAERCWMTDVPDLSLLGARVGEEVMWTSSAKLEVAQLLHQPEAAPRSVS